MAVLVAHEMSFENTTDGDMLDRGRFPGAIKLFCAETEKKGSQQASKRCRKLLKNTTQNWADTVSVEVGEGQGCRKEIQPQCLRIGSSASTGTNQTNEDNREKVCSRQTGNGSCSVSLQGACACVRAGKLTNETCRFSQKKTRFLATKFE